MASGEYLQHSLSQSALTGKILGPYTIQTLIAQGGMGAVYLAFHQQLRRQVALKTMHPGADESDEETQRFVNEARILARINHPNVVPIYDAGETSGTRWIAMEWVRGKTLHELLRERGQLEPKEAVAYIRDVASGLAEAHRLGILHRDLKPANILIDGEGVVRLTDFGIAKASEDQGLTKTGIVMGTPNYMAPEQAQGQRDVDARADVYGLAAVLYELLTGRPPFNKPSQLATLQAVVADPLEPPRAVRAELSRDLEAIVLTGMRKEREHRYQDLDHFAYDLERFLDDEPVSVRPRGAGARMFMTVRRRGLLLATVAVVTSGFALLTLAAMAPALRGRSQERFAQEASAWLDDHLDGARHTLRAGSPEELDALRASLHPEPVQKAAEEQLAAGSAGQRAAVQQGLGSEAELEERLAPVRAEVLLELARARRGEERLGLLAEACVDGAAPVARRAELQLAEALAAHPTTESRRLAEQALSALSQAEDPSAEGARHALARLDANRLEFLQADAGWGDAPPDADRDVAALAALLRGRVPLPPHTLAFLVNTTAGPCLALAQGSAIDLLRLAVDDDGAPALRPAGRWALPGRILHATTIRRDGRLDPYVVCATKDGKLRLCTFEPRVSSEETLRVSDQDAPFEGVGTVAAVTHGDFNGDGRLDLALISRNPGNSSCIIYGDPQRTTRMRLFGSTPSLVYRFERALAADLDGDGKDELLIATSNYIPGLFALKAPGPDQPVENLGTLPIGYVTGMTRAPGGGALAVVDYDDGTYSVPEDPARPWFGRDGVYRLGLREGQLTLSGRWTIGDDDPSSRADRQGIREVGATVLPLRGEDWVLRSWRQGSSPLRLEACPLSALSGDENPSARIDLSSLAPPSGWSTADTRSLDVDDDGIPELLVGGYLLGAAPRREGRVAHPSAQSAAGDRALLQAVRRLRALEQDAQAEALADRLRADYPTSWAAQQASLEAVDSLIARGLRAKRRARSAFRVLAPGAADLDRARELLERAAGDAESLVGRGVDPGAALFKAAHAWTEADRPRKALSALRRLESSGGLSADDAARLGRELTLLEARALGASFDLRFGSPRAGVAPGAPLRARAVGESLALPLDGSCEDGAYVARVLDPRALRVEAEIEPQGAAWQATLEVGAFAIQDGRPRDGTGFRVAHWDVHTRRMRIQGMVRGKRAGPYVDWPSFEDRLVVACEVRPHYAGGSLVRLTVQSPEGVVLFDDEGVAALPPFEQSSREMLVGARCPIGRSLSDVSFEQSAFPMRSRVLLDRLTVTSRSTQRAGTLPPLLAAHARLAAGDDTQAQAAYSRLLKRGERKDRFEARFHLAFAEGRASKANAHEHLQVAAQSWPLQTLLSLEDLAFDVLLDKPQDLQTLRAALEAMGSRDRTMGERIIASTLAGQEPKLTPQNATDLLRPLYYYTLMRNVSDPQRWQWREAYWRARPGTRLPRGYPQVFPFSRRTLDDDAYLSALRLSDGTALFRSACGAWLARPDRIEAQLMIASLYARVGRGGTAQGFARPLLRRDLSPKDRMKVLSVMAQSYYASHDNEPLLQTLTELVQLGVEPSKLEGFRQRLGHDPRFQALFATDEGD